MNADKRPTKKLIPTSWQLVHDQATVIDSLVLGTKGIAARLTESAGAIVRGDRAAALQQLGHAAVLLAIVRQLGWEAEGAQQEIERQALLIDCEVACVQ